MLSKLMTRIRALLRKSEMERELKEELRYHIERQTEQNIRMGMNPEEARHAACKTFGGVEQAKERRRPRREMDRGFVARPALRRANAGEESGLFYHCNQHPCDRHRRKYGDLFSGLCGHTSAAPLCRVRAIGDDQGGLAG